MGRIKPEFHEWTGAELREWDLPAGVRYRLACVHAEYIAAEKGKFVTVRDLDGEPCFYVPRYERGDTPVTILDWPDWCGPRPDAQPTFKQIREMAPNPRAQTVWLKDGRKTAGLAACHYEGSGWGPCSGFLGWLTWEEE